VVLDMKKKSILITGVAGTGKTSLSRKLNEMGFKAYDMDDYPGLFTMFDKRTGEPVVDHDNTDLEKVGAMDWVCDTEKLASLITHEPDDIAFYCGNASDMDTILPFFDSVILLKIGQETMRHRLTTRTENDFGRTAEIQDWIMKWKHLYENEMEEKGAIVVDAHQSLDDIAKEVIQKATNADALANEAMDRGT